MRTLASLCLLLLSLAAVESFQLVRPPSMAGPSSTSCNGLFDGLINSMEAGYKGEDSAFQKQKAADEAKRLAKKQKADTRKKKGWVDLKDMKERSYATLKYDDSNDPPKEEKKKLFGLF